MGRLATYIGLLVMATAAMAAQPTSQVFRLRHRTVQEAVAFIAPMLSPSGSVLIQPGNESITVRDGPDVLARVASSLAGWDVPPVSYRVRVRVFIAYSGVLVEGKQPERLPDLNIDLFRLFHFSSYLPLDDLQLVAVDGNSVETNISDRYKLRFRVSAAAQDPERLQLKPLELLRREPAPSGVEGSALVMRTVVSLTVGQVGVVAAAQSELADRALLLVMTATKDEGQRR
ncbi:MAG: secretin N-terminal domain-containing protein [Acidobacteriota bacterium]